jgi:hypothetical protein
MQPAGDLPERIDGRTLPARTCRRWLAQLSGAEHLSFKEQSLCRRVVAYELWLGSVDARAQSGQDVTRFMAVYTQATNGLLGLYRALEQLRRQRPLPDLRDYLNQHAADDDDVTQDAASIGNATPDKHEEADVVQDTVPIAEIAPAATAEGGADGSA